MSQHFIALAVCTSAGLMILGCDDGSTTDANGTSGGSGSPGVAGAGASSGGATAGSGGASAGSAGMLSGGGGGVGGSGGSAGTGGAGGSAHGKAMSFFVSSEPPSGTGKLGGLAGADAHCKMLASQAGAVRMQWVAYLSAAQGNVDARDRIGSGPWYNQKQQVFAANLAALHSLPTITPNDAASRAAYVAAKPSDGLFMDEKGAAVPSDVHDILTGSKPDGTLAADKTCSDWTSDSPDDVAALGHSDTPGAMMYSPSWNAAHDSSGCGLQDLDSTGGEGRIYCFATD